MFISPDISAIAQKFYLPGIDDIGARGRQIVVPESEGKTFEGDTGVNANLAKVEEKRRAKQATAKQKLLAKKKKTLAEIARENKSGIMSQLYGVPSKNKLLDEAYPDTLRYPITK